MKPTLVAAGIIRKDSKILVAQRLDDCKIFPLKWEFPGGKVEFLEHPEDALVREIKEELNIEISVDKLYTVISDIQKKDGKDFHVVVLVFLADYVSGDLKHVEVKDSALISLAEADQFDFAPVDKQVIGMLQKEPNVLAD